MLGLTARPRHHMLPQNNTVVILIAIVIVKNIDLNAEVNREAKVAWAHPVREALRSQHRAVLVRNASHLLQKTNEWRGGGVLTWQKTSGERFKRTIDYIQL